MKSKTEKQVRNTSASRPLTLLVITGTWPPMHCGVGDYTSRLCKQWVRSGCRVHVLTSQGAHADLAMQTGAGLEVLPQIRVWNWQAVAKACALAAELKPDAILFAWPTAAYGRSLAVNWLPWRLRQNNPGIPVITMLHEFRYFKLITRLRLWPGLRASHRVVVVDPEDLAAIQRMYPWAFQRCRHIPIGSNLPKATAGMSRLKIRKQLGLAPTDFVAAYFGFANPPKGLEDLFLAAEALRAKYPRLRLLLLPRLLPGQAYQQGLLAQLRELKLETITIQPDFAEPHHAAAILAAADCAVLPFRDGVSLKRGSFFACLELGLPVLTTLPANGAGFPFQPGKEILAVPAGAPAELARALERLAEDPGLRSRLAWAARRKLKPFSWEAIAGQYLGLLAEAKEEAR